MSGRTADGVGEVFLFLFFIFFVSHIFRDLRNFPEPAPGYSIDTSNSSEAVRRD